MFDVDVMGSSSCTLCLLVRRVGVPLVGSSVFDGLGSLEDGALRFLEVEGG